MASETTAPETTTLNVTGMHCDGCAERIGRALERLPGVEVLAADHRQGKVEVRLDPGRSSLDAVRERIEHLGYEVER